MAAASWPQCDLMFWHYKGLVSGKNSVRQQGCEGIRLQIEGIAQLGLSSELCDLIDDIQGCSSPKKTISNCNTTGMWKHLIKL